jgi:hypothetical protein
LHGADAGFNTGIVDETEYRKAKNKSLTINVQKNGKVFIQGTEVALSELAAKLRLSYAPGGRAALSRQRVTSARYSRAPIRATPTEH